MDQGKTIPFSIVKQKIIKTDEVLRMYVEVTNKLKKAQQACKEIKLKYDQMVTDSSRIKLEHERCTFNIENLRHRNDILDKSNKELLEQKLLLEEKYNQQTVQSQLNIKHLQDELQMLHEISSAAENSPPKKKRNSNKISEKIVEKDEKNIENQSVGVLNRKYADINNLLVSDDSLFRKQAQCNPQVKYETMDEIISEEHAIIFDNTIDNISHEEKSKENHCRFTQNIGTQTHKSNIERKNVYSQTLETFKHLDKIISENRLLKQRMFECDKEIMKMQAKLKIVKVSCSIQTEESEVDDGFVEYILKDMKIPNALLPIVDSPKAANISNSTVPGVTAIPSISVKDAIETNSFVEQQECNKSTTLGTDRNNLQNSSIRTDKVPTRNSRHSRRYKYKCPVINNDVNSFVKLRRKCLRRLTKKKSILNKEIRKMRKLRKQDCLLETLCTLKELNINFSISNNSSSPNICRSKEEKKDFSYPDSGHTQRKILIPQKSEAYLTQQLNCICTKCNQSSMLLNEVGSEKHLLGFYSIKNEVNTPASSRMENNWDTKSLNQLRQINSSLNESNNMPETILERLAELVSRKLSERKKDTTKPREIVTDQDSTFHSETEPEIERLFEKSNIDILKRNKMLLETAKKEYQMLELSTADNLEMEHDHCSQEMEDALFDPDLTFLDKGADSEREDSIIPEDSNDNVCAENDDTINFELPSCPQLISPIKSVKNVNVFKTEEVSDSLCINADLVESNRMSSNNVQSGSNNFNFIKLLDVMSNKEAIQSSKHNDITLKKKEKDCLRDTNNISIDHRSTTTLKKKEKDCLRDTNNISIDHRSTITRYTEEVEQISINTNIYEENDFEETDDIENEANNQITGAEKTNSITYDNIIKQYVSSSEKTIKLEETKSTVLETYKVHNGKNEIDSASICPESSIPDNINITNDGNESENVPIFPEFLIQDNINVADERNGSKSIPSYPESPISDNINVTNEFKNVPVSPESPIPDNVNVTNGKNISESVPICSESPIPDNIDITEGNEFENVPILPEFLIQDNINVADERNGSESIPICPESPILDNKNVTNEFKNAPVSPKSPIRDNVNVTNGKNMSESVPICPESPIPDNINVCVKSPILIPLDKLDRESTKNSKAKANDKLLLSPQSNDLTFAPQKIRRSKRISEKRCSILEKRTNDFNKIANNTLSPHPLPHGNNLIKQTLLEECLKRVAQNNTNSVREQAANSRIGREGTSKRARVQQAANSSIGHEDNNKREPVEEGANSSIGHKDNSKRVPATSVAKRRVSKLKSKILREVRAKRQIFMTGSKCCTSKISENQPTVRYSKPSSQDKKTASKIHIVQNILIPANSNHAVDLLKEHQHETVAPPVNNCDIRLISEQHYSSLSSTAVPNCPTKNKFNSNICDIRNKKKRVGRTKTKDDLLSKIMREMDKDRPEITLKQKIEVVGSKERIPDSTDEKQWRKGVLVIADNIHNISSKSAGHRENSINQDTVFNPTSTLTLKRKILLSRLSKLSSEEMIPDEIILEFKRQDVNSIAELILQKVSQDIWDKPEHKYYPAPLMTKTQRILLGLMVRLEQENMENIMDTFICKVESFLFKIGCGIRTLIPIVRLYMAVCKLRRDIDQMRHFCCDAFLFMDNLAIPLFFTVLTSWTEVLPMEPDIKNYPLTKILIQVVHLKNCKRPGYNLLPLKCLFNQFYGYPKERWECDEVFKELYQQYLERPDKSSDMAIRLLCKHKDTKWVYKKVNEFFKPLIYKIPSENVNFKATVIILIGNMCTHFNPNIELDKCSLDDLRRWLIGLTEDENIHDLITNSVNLSVSKLPTKKMINLKQMNGPKKIKKGKKCKKKKKKAIVK